MSSPTLTSPVRNRMYILDNAKFLLITGVLLMHFLAGNVESPKLPYHSPFFQSIEIFLFLFVMQSFVFVSGYFSKGELTPEYIQKSLMQLIVPYIILATFDKILGGKYYKGYLLEPPPVLWYLLALFFWRIFLVVLKQIKTKYCILLSLICAIYVGYDNNVSFFLTLSRTFCFFPFFLLGHFYGENIINLNFKYQKLVGFVFLIMIFFVILWKYSNVNPKWLEMSFSYDSLGATGYSGAIIRFSLIVLSAIASLSFFMLVPKNKTVFSELGTRSIYAYVLHPYIILGLLVYGISTHLSVIFLILVIPFSVLCSVILSSKLTEKIFKPILFPKVVKKIFVPLETEKI